MISKAAPPISGAESNVRTLNPGHVSKSTLPPSAPVAGRKEQQAPTGFKNHPVFRAIASMWITVAILFILGVACAIATFIEARAGTPAAQAMVYRARWFEGLIALMILNLVAMFVMRWPYRKARIGFVITHLSMIWILISAGITRYFGYEGYMPIREGTSSGFMYSREDYLQLEVGPSRAAVPINLWKTGPQNLRQDIALDSGTYRIDVVEHWPQAAEQLVEGSGGAPAAQVTLVTGNHRHPEMLRAGTPLVEGGATVELVQDALSAPASTSPYGDIVVQAAGNTVRLPVPWEGEAEATVGDVRVRILEFRPTFKVGTARSASDVMDNPAVRISLQDAKGRQEERLLFALHPEFDMDHTGAERTFPDVSATYGFEKSVKLRVTAPGKADAVSSFPVTLAEPQSPDAGRPIPAGQQFQLQTGSTLNGAGFSLALGEILQSAVTRIVASDDGDDPAMARVRVTNPEGAQAETMVRLRYEDTDFTLGNETAHIAIGPRRVDLPYRIQLDDFVLVTYPGSENPAGFESHVRVIDEANGTTGQPYRIYMNHPLTYRGFKHFQSSYDQDRKGTVLSVNHDPGKWPTYIGYFLISLGFLITLTRGKLWMREAH